MVPPFQSAPSGQPLDKSVGEGELNDDDEVAGVDDDMSPSFHFDDGQDEPLLPQLTPSSTEKRKPRQSVV